MNGPNGIARRVEPGRPWRYALRLVATIAACLAPPAVSAAEIHVVKNPLPAGGQRALFQTSMRLVREMQIRDADGDETAPVFGRISDAAVDSRGRVYVLDASQCTVFIYDADGAYLGRIGREGDGPGEFRSPEAVVTGAGDSLFVADRRSVSVFDADGTFAGRFDHSLRSASVRGMVVSPDGHVFLSSFDIWSRHIIHEFSRSGTRLVSFCDSYAAGADEDWRIEQVYAGGSIDLDPRGRVCYSQLTPYQIRIFTRHGDLVSIIERDNTFRPPEVRRLGHETLEFRMASGSYGFCVLSDGTYVNSVFAYEDDRAGVLPETFVDVFGADGVLAGSIAVEPSGVLLCRDARDRLYFREYGDTSAVVRCRLQRSQRGHEATKRNVR